MNSLPPVLFAFAELVLTHPEWEVSVLTQTLGVSNKTLARICSRVLGLSPKQWLLSYRMRCWRMALQDQTDVLESALERSQRDPGAWAWPFEISRTEFALAEALWRLDPTHAPRSRALAAAARTSLLRFDPRFQGEVAQIDEWLTRLPAPSGG